MSLATRQERLAWFNTILDTLFMGEDYIVYLQLLINASIDSNSPLSNTIIPELIVMLHRGDYMNILIHPYMSSYWNIIKKQHDIILNINNIKECNIQSSQFISILSQHLYEYIQEKRQDNTNTTNITPATTTIMLGSDHDDNSSNIIIEPVSEYELCELTLILFSIASLMLYTQINYANLPLVFPVTETQPCIPNSSQDLMISLFDASIAATSSTTISDNKLNKKNKKGNMTRFINTPQTIMVYTSLKANGEDTYTCSYHPLLLVISRSILGLGGIIPSLIPSSIVTSSSVVTSSSSSSSSSCLYQHSVLSRTLGNVLLSKTTSDTSSLSSSPSSTYFNIPGILTHSLRALKLHNDIMLSLTSILRDEYNMYVLLYRGIYGILSNNNNKSCSNRDNSPTTMTICSEFKCHTYIDYYNNIYNKSIQEQQYNILSSSYMLNCIDPTQSIIYVLYNIYNTIPSYDVLKAYNATAASASATPTSVIKNTTSSLPSTIPLQALSVHDILAYLLQSSTISAYNIEHDNTSVDDGNTNNNLTKSSSSSSQTTTTTTTDVKITIQVEKLKKHMEETIKEEDIPIIGYSPLTQQHIHASYNPISIYIPKVKVLHNNTDNNTNNYTYINAQIPHTFFPTFYSSICIELSHLSLSFFNYHRSFMLLSLSKMISGTCIRVAGIMGRRTRYQTRSTSQLTGITYIHHSILQHIKFDGDLEYKYINNRTKSDSNNTSSSHTINILQSLDKKYIICNNIDDSLLSNYIINDRPHIQPIKSNEKLDNITETETETETETDADDTNKEKDDSTISSSNTSTPVTTANPDDGYKGTVNTPYQTTPRIAQMTTAYSKNSSVSTDDNGTFTICLTTGGYMQDTPIDSVDDLFLNYMLPDTQNPAIDIFNQKKKIDNTNITSNTTTNEVQTEENTTTSTATTKVFSYNDDITNIDTSDYIVHVNPDDTDDNNTANNTTNIDSDDDEPIEFDPEAEENKGVDLVQFLAMTKKSVILSSKYDDDDDNSYDHTTVRLTTSEPSEAFIPYVITTQAAILISAVTNYLHITSPNSEIVNQEQTCYITSILQHHYTQTTRYKSDVYTPISHLYNSYTSLFQYIMTSIPFTLILRALIMRSILEASDSQRHKFRSLAQLETLSNYYIVNDENLRTIHYKPTLYSEYTSLYHNNSIDNMLYDPVLEKTHNYQSILLSNIMRIYKGYPHISPNEQSIHVYNASLSLVRFRMNKIFVSNGAPWWDVLRECGDTCHKLGFVNTALRCYVVVQLWGKVISTLIQTGRRGDAQKILRSALVLTEDDIENEMCKPIIHDGNDNITTTATTTIDDNDQYNNDDEDDEQSPSLLTIKSDNTTTSTADIDQQDGSLLNYITRSLKVATSTVTTLSGQHNTGISLSDYKLYHLLAESLTKPSQKIKYWQYSWELSQSTYPPPMRSLGKFYASHNQYMNAYKCYQNALSLNNSDHQTWYECGVSAMRLCMYDKAAPCFSSALRIKQDISEGWNNLAACHIYLQQYSSAFHALSQCLMFRRNSWKIWENYLQCGLILGHYSETLTALQHINKLKGTIDPQTLLPIEYTAKHSKLHILALYCAFFQFLRADVRKSIHNQIKQHKTLLSLDDDDNNSKDNKDNSNNASATDRCYLCLPSSHFIIPPLLYQFIDICQVTLNNLSSNESKEESMGGRMRGGGEDAGASNSISADILLENNNFIDSTSITQLQNNNKGIIDRDDDGLESFCDEDDTTHNIKTINKQKSSLDNNTDTSSSSSDVSSNTADSPVMEGKILFDLLCKTSKGQKCIIYNMLGQSYELSTLGLDVLSSSSNDTTTTTTETSSAAALNQLRMIHARSKQSISYYENVVNTILQLNTSILYSTTDYTLLDFVIHTLTRMYNTAIYIDTHFISHINNNSIIYTNNDKIMYANMKYFVSLFYDRIIILLNKEMNNNNIIHLKTYIEQIQAIKDDIQLLIKEQDNTLAPKPVISTSVTQTTTTKSKEDSLYDSYMSYDMY